MQKSTAFDKVSKKHDRLGLASPVLQDIAKEKEDIIIADSMREHRKDHWMCAHCIVYVKNPPLYRGSREKIKKHLVER